MNDVWRLKGHTSTTCSTKERERIGYGEMHSTSHLVLTKANSTGVASLSQTKTMNGQFTSLGEAWLSNNAF